MKGTRNQLSSQSQGRQISSQPGVYLFDWTMNHISYIRYYTFPSGTVIKLRGGGPLIPHWANIVRRYIMQRLYSIHNIFNMYSMYILYRINQRHNMYNMYNVHSMYNMYVCTYVRVYVCMYLVPPSTEYLVPSI